MMSFVSTLGRVVTTALVLVTFLSHQRMVFAELAINEKMDTFVEADNKPIESLAALSSGVYSVELARGVRPGCGGGNTSPGDQGMELSYYCTLSFFVPYIGIYIHDSTCLLL
jgi:hypothetical protein